MSAPQKLYDKLQSQQLAHARLKPWNILAAPRAGSCKESFALKQNECSILGFPIQHIRQAGEFKYRSASAQFTKSEPTPCP